MTTWIRLKNGAVFSVEAESTTPQPPDEAASRETEQGDLDFGPRGAPLSKSARTRSLPSIPERQFSHAVEVVEGIAEELTERLLRDDNKMRLSELALDLQVGFDAKGNVLIATGQASASLKLHLKWQPGK